MAVAAAAPRILTAYSYVNLSAGPIGCGTLWFDSETQSLAWEQRQAAPGTTTPWHGHYDVLADNRGLLMAFDAFYGTRHQHARMNTVTLMTTIRGEFVGHDYRDRYIRMRPVCRYLYDDLIGNWREKQQWCPRCQTWTDVPTDIPLVAVVAPAEAALTDPSDTAVPSPRDLAFADADTTDGGYVLEGGRASVEYSTALADRFELLD